MPRILLTHSPEALRNYYGERALAGLRVLGEVRLHCGDESLQGEPRGGAGDAGERGIRRRGERDGARVAGRSLARHLALPAIDHQSLETVAQAAEILNGRAPKGAVNAEHWRRKELFKT